MGMFSKIFNASSKGTSGAVEGMGKAGGTVLKGVGKLTVGTLGLAGDAVVGTVAVGAGAVKGAVSRPGAAAKAVAGLVAIASAVGVIGYFARKNRRADKPLPEERVEDLLPPPMMPMMDMSMMPQQNTMMGMQPVEGPKAQAVKEQRAAASVMPQQPGM